MQIEADISQDLRSYGTPWQKTQRGLQVVLGFAGAMTAFVTLLIVFGMVAFGISSNPSTTIASIGGGIALAVPVTIGLSATVLSMMGRPMKTWHRGISVLAGLLFLTTGAYGLIVDTADWMISIWPAIFGFCIIGSVLVPARKDS